MHVQGEHGGANQSARDLRCCRALTGTGTPRSTSTSAGERGSEYIYIINYRLVRGLRFCDPKCGSLIDRDFRGPRKGLGTSEEERPHHRSASYRRLIEIASIRLTPVS
jgi:hypothetical protein